ncbi:ABC transporter substrate-binding protein [Pseudodesulfovibrio sediminis]|uniref:ABC transporter substrate-binding protein n=1 Tax=Pseudodesulfovibrio sediminis TaxID=2810563 RepID=A0ABN6ETV6_9BACT|nr:ABC transporter substrate-binding protein [Pseudodesulfovibrio sediminis]
MLLLFSVLMVTWATPASAEDLNVYCELTGRSAMYQDDVLTGWGVEIVQEIMARVGSTNEIEPLPWARAYETVLVTPNTALFSTTRTEEREQHFHWIGPFVRLQWILVARKGSGIVINSLDDAKKVRSIGTYIDDARDRFLLRNGFLNLDRSTSNVLNYRKLNRGRIDLLAATPIGIVETAERAGVDIADLEVVHVIKEMDLYLAINKESDPQTVTAWKAAFAEMQRDGTFAVIFSKWQPGQDIPYDVRLPWRE